MRRSRARTDGARGREQLPPGREPPRKVSSFLPLRKAAGRRTIIAGRRCRGLVSPAGAATTRSAAAETGGPAARRAAWRRAARRAARLDERQHLRVLATEGAERARLDDERAASADRACRLD